MSDNDYTPETPYELWLAALRPGDKVTVRHGFGFQRGVAEVVEPAKGLTQPKLRMVRGANMFNGRILKRDGTWQINGGDRYPWANLR